MGPCSANGKVRARLSAFENPFPAIARAWDSSPVLISSAFYCFFTSRNTAPSPGGMERGGNTCMAWGSCFAVKQAHRCQGYEPPSLEVPGLSGGRRGGRRGAFSFTRSQHSASHRRDGRVFSAINGLVCHKSLCTQASSVPT
ncbi:unnamed protein product [Lepidochelys kempii]